MPTYLPTSDKITMEIANVNSKQKLKVLDGDMQLFRGTLNHLVNVVYNFVNDKSNSEGKSPLSINELFSALNIPLVHDVGTHSSGGIKTIEIPKDSLEGVLSSCVNPPSTAHPNLTETVNPPPTAHPNLTETVNPRIAEAQNILLELSKANNTLTQLENKWSGLESEVNKQGVAINQLNQYLRLNNLLFHHMVNIPENLYGTAFSIEMANWINANIPALPSGPLNYWEIDAAHIQRKVTDRNSNHTKYVVIVRFVSRNRRNEVFFAKKQLLESGSYVTITEQLTAENLDLLNEARKKVGFTDAWSNQGKIFISTGPKSKKMIKNKKELEGVKQRDLTAKTPRGRKKGIRRNDATGPKRNFNKFNSKVAHGNTATGANIAMFPNFTGNPTGTVDSLPTHHATGAVSSVSTHHSTNVNNNHPYQQTHPGQPNNNFFVGPDTNTCPQATFSVASPSEFPYLNSQ